MGVNHNVFVEMNDDYFVTKEGCAKWDGGYITHAVNAIGYGTDPVYGEYWLIKNSWSEKWADNGFIRLARGVGCGSIGNLKVFTYGDPASYFEEQTFLK